MYDVFIKLMRLVRGWMETGVQEVDLGGAFQVCYR